MLPLAIALCSLLKQLKTERKLLLYLVHSDLPRDFLAAVGSRFDVVEVEFPRTDVLSSSNRSRYSPEAVVPVYLDQLIPENRVLFLDSDVLVVDDIDRLWNHNLEGACLGAARDWAVGNEENKAYFNAGVLLMDLDECRRTEILKKTRQIMGRQTTRFLHQDALNAVASDCWRQLHPRWNVLAGLCGRRFSGPAGPEFQSAIQDPGIVHFAGRFKPWVFKVGGSFAEIYSREAQARPFGVVPAQPTLGERFLSLYDRFLRDYCYPLEQRAWQRNWV